MTLLLQILLASTPALLPVQAEAEEAAATQSEDEAGAEESEKPLLPLEPALGRFHDLKDGDDPQPAIDQLHAIGKLDTAEAVDALLALVPQLEGDLKLAAIHGIGLNRSERSGVVLRELAEDDDKAVRRQAHRELADGSEEDLLWLRDERLDAERDLNLRAEILEALVDARVDDITHEVLQAAKQRKNKVWTAAGVYGIGELQLERGLRYVEEYIGDPDMVLRQRSWEALASCGGRDAFELLLEAYADGRNSGQRHKIEAQMARAKSEKEVAVLIRQGVGSRDEDVVAGALKAVAFAAKHQPEMCGPVLLDALEDRDPDLRTIAIEGIVRARPRGAILELIERLDHEDYQTRTDAIWALSQLGDLPVEAEQKFIALTKDPRPAVRLHAVGALRWFVPSDASFQAALDAVHDELWSVRSEAVSTLLAFRRTEAVPALVHLVENERGRVRDDAVRALEKLTGQDFGPLIGNWARWWADRGDDYEVPSVEEVERMVAARAAARKSANLDTTAKASEYHGIAVPRGGVVFILDVSGSMEKRFSETETYFEYFSEALLTTIENLTTDTDFNLIVFSGTARAWKDQLVVADEENKEAAHRFLNETRAGGPTNLYQSLILALDFTETQTIFLLTDGDPTVGRLTQPEAILAEIEYLNRDRRIQIHTIAAGDVKAEFLADLAAANGGEAVDLTHLGLDKERQRKN